MADEKDQGLYVVIAAAIGLLVLGAVYWRFRAANQVWKLADHADLGNAMAPAVAFLTLLAVVAALWSVQIQRTELALQRKELQETRGEMVEQRKQFERTAQAQEALAESQKRLACAQEEANTYARVAAEIQRRANVVNATAAIPHVAAGKAASEDPGSQEAFSSLVDGLLLIVRHELDGLGVKHLRDLAKKSEGSGV